MSGALIAVVEDDSALCELLRDILTEEGYQVVCAASGSDGLALICQERPDLVLLDVHLSGSVDGLSVVERLRACPVTADMPIILSTADSHFLYNQTEVLHVLRCDVLSKPFEINTLLKAVERAIN